MDEVISVGDRVRWRSTRANQNGNKWRMGKILKVAVEGGYALVRPDKGNGNIQAIVLRRLHKVTPTKPEDL